VEPQTQGDILPPSRGRFGLSLLTHHVDTMEREVEFFGAALKIHQGALFTVLPPLLLYCVALFSSLFVLKYIEFGEDIGNGGQVWDSYVTLADVSPHCPTLTSPLPHPVPYYY
jgi:hypothetical protein